jgi:hypothetical protein
MTIPGKVVMKREKRKRGKKGGRVENRYVNNHSRYKVHSMPSCSQT